MSAKFEKLKTLLMELFQLDQPDLDFGFYRVMHARSAEVTQFLEKDLLPQVRTAFEQYQPADKAALEKQRAKLVADIEGAGMNPADSPKVKELDAKIRDDAVDLGALESEVYDHLFSFFRRYYSEGDFLSKRVYKPGVYAIPYEGEEVKLHWANADQYYIKTSEYLRDYAFRLQPDNEAVPMRVHFKLVDAAEGEHGNVKEQAGKERRFKLAPEPFVALEDGELVVRFTYEPDPTKQAPLNAAAEATLLASSDETIATWIKLLKAEHVRTDGTKSGTSRLRVHLDRYAARNTFDYFIHKDLGAFLRRELDFYIKNEVMHLDDVENESAPRVEQYLSKIKVIRRIAGKIITFLAQLEDFQKKLWLKKKFVTDTSWCIRLGIIPESFYPEIATNDAQREEWVQLCAIDEIKGDLANPAYSTPLSREFLSAQSTLTVDTRHFAPEFATHLLDALGDVDEQTDGVLFHSENFQALKLMQSRYHEQVKCIYIDPPYNTGGDGFAYRDGYQHSSWLSQIAASLLSARRLLINSGFMFVSIDDHEIARLDQALSLNFGEANRVAIIAQKSRDSISNDVLISGNHNFLLTYAADYGLAFANRAKFGLDPDLTGFSNPDNDPNGPWKYMPTDGPGGAAKGNPHYTFKGVTGFFRYSIESMQALFDKGEIVVRNGTISRKNYLARAKTKRRQVTTWWDDVGTTTAGTTLLSDVLGQKMFSNPKPVTLIERCGRLCLGAEERLLDYFAGSGTSGHAAINLNREDGGKRKFLLVEMGEYFESVLLARLKKVSFTPDWKDGKPKRRITLQEAARGPRVMKVVRLESYEDTLNNLQLSRTKGQQGTLDEVQARGESSLSEQYMLRYMLDVETRGSRSLLNVAAFIDPTAYKLKVKRPGSDESREVNVDLIETFNWLIGITVRHFAAPHTFRADAARDSEGRLQVTGRLRPEADGPHWFRTVTGTLPDGRKALVVWRKRPGGESTEGVEHDNLVLDAWFTKQGYSSKDSEFDVIYVNGGNNLENLRTPDDRWKVRLIEEDFFRLMFETEGT
jgi:adenine-specific DNA-methyltransferase